MVTQQVPRQICVTSGGGPGAGAGAGGGFGGGSGGYGSGGGGGGAGLGGFADHRKDDFSDSSHLVQKRKVQDKEEKQDALISSKPFDDIIFVSTNKKDQKISLEDLDKFKFN